jgi:hypothetical protein
MPKDMTARQLIKQVPAVATLDANFTADTATLAGEGWEVIAPAGRNMVFVWRGFIDLAGYTQHDLTFFSQTVDIQDNGIPLTSPSVALCTIVDLVTTRRILDDELSAINSNGFIQPAPGIPLPGLDIQEVVYGSNRSFTPYSATNGALKDSAEHILRNVIEWLV